MATSTPSDVHWPAAFTAAEKIFTFSGFISRIVPLLATLNVLIVAGVLLVLGPNAWMVSVALVLFCGLFIPAITIIRAASKHDEFKLRFGATYARLVVDGSVPLNAANALLLASPAPYEHLIAAAHAARKSDTGS